MAKPDNVVDAIETLRAWLRSLPDRNRDWESPTYEPVAEEGQQEFEARVIAHDLLEAVNADSSCGCRLCGA